MAEQTFYDVWDSLAKNIDENNYGAAAKDLIRLFDASVVGDENYKIVSGYVAIGPASSSGLLSYVKLMGDVGKFLIKNWFKLLTLAGTSYGLAFGSEWFAKEGLIEQVSIPLSDLMRNYRYKADPATLESIKKYYAQYKTNVARAKSVINTWSWLWPFTRAQWKKAIESYEMDVAERGKEIEQWDILATGKGMPELVKTFVRDIIDGDTIDVSLNAMDAVTGKSFMLPEFGTTGHARIRIVGINAPEKSPKGEILCSDVEIYKVEGKYADDARSNLLFLNDKEVILKTDPNNLIDTHGRILAGVYYQGEDMGLQQIRKGLACRYYREPHKYVNEDLYRITTTNAIAKGVGMWPKVEEEEVKPIIPPVEVEKAVVEKAVVALTREQELFKLLKAQQVDMLLKLGVAKKNIPQYEKDRVALIMSLEKGEITQAIQVQEQAVAVVKEIERKPTVSLPKSDYAVYVETDIMGTTVIIDGEERTEKTPSLYYLKNSNARITVKNPFGRWQEFGVSVKKGYVQGVRVQLKEPYLIEYIYYREIEEEKKPVTEVGIRVY